MHALQRVPSRYVSDQFETLAESLRAMMLAGLQRVLATSSVNTQTLPVFENGAARLLEDLLDLSANNLSAAQSDAAFDALFLVTTPPGLNPTQRALLARQVAPGLWARLRMKLLNLFRAKRHVPLDLAPDAAHFSDLWQFHIFAHFAVQAEVAHILHSHLCGRVLLWPPDPQPPRLETATFWWLASIGFAGPAALKHKISNLADTLCQRTGWAGFWDQYLLSLSQTSGVDLPATFPELPLTAAGGSALSAPPDDDALQARTGWRREAPAYASALLGEGI